MRASEFTKPGTITLDQIYHGQMPDNDEHIWNYVSERDFKIPFTINTIQPRVLTNILEIQYRVDDIDELFDRMEPEQEEIVRDYQRDPALSQKIIVLHKDHIIDGNHRALAAALAKKPIRYIDVSEGGENLNEDVVGPFKVIDYDGGQVTLDTGKTIKLSPQVKDKPRVGYNYAFDMENNIATKLVLLTVDNVVIADNEILMIKRKNEPYANHWALPGGFIDPGETPEQAARRELEEETGLVTNSAMRYIGKFDTLNRDPRMRDAWSYAFLINTKKTDVQAGDDASAAKWIPINKLDNLPIAFDHKKIISVALGSV